MSEDKTPAEWKAPEGRIWVCAACGKYGPQRDRIGDASCFSNAVLCFAKKNAIDGWRADPEHLKK
jgi:hypothetical protein